MTTRLLHAGFGVLATIVGVAAGHLVAAVTEPAASPVLAVGSTVIDLTPTPLKEWAIAHFGTNDKTVLVGSVLAGVLLLAAVAGLLARRRFVLGAGLLVVLVAIAASAALTRPTAGGADLLPSLAAAVTGVAALAWLVRSAAVSARRRALATGWREPPGRAGRRRCAGRGRRGHGRRRALDHVVPHPPGERRPPRGHRPGPGVPHRAGRAGPRDHAVPDVDRRLLPRRHAAHPAPSSASATGR